MSGAVLVLVLVPVFVLLAALLLVGAARRRDAGEAIGSLSRETRQRDRGRSRSASLPTETPQSGRDVERTAALERRQPSTEVVKASAAPLAPYVPPDDESLGVTRRQFLNRSVVNLMAFGITAFSLSSIAFLWPPATGGFGSKIKLSKKEVSDGLADGEGFYYVPEGRMWVTAYPHDSLDKAARVYDPAVLEGMKADVVGTQAGIVALYQKCVHLGCRVPECKTSQWFECPCHGSQYNRAGEKKGGPAPRGLDRFPVTVAGDAIIVDTGLIIQGPPIGTNTTGQEAEGPHCISGGE